MIATATGLLIFAGAVILLAWAVALLAGTLGTLDLSDHEDQEGDEAP